MFRFALDALDVHAKLKSRNVILHMIDLGGNGISKLVFTILSAVAEAERDRIRKRSGTGTSAASFRSEFGSARMAVSCRMKPNRR